MSYPSFPFYSFNPTPIPALYESAMIAPIIPSLPPSAPFNQIDSLPQPSPPVGWSMVGGTTSVKQDFASVEVTYEYKYAPPGKEYKVLPVQISQPPAVPPYWTVTKSTYTVEKEEKSHVYKYILKYTEPPSAAADKPKAK